MAENIMDTLRKRGFIKQTVFEDELYEKLGKESVPFYIGFDPTADSLHVGHFFNADRHAPHAAGGTQADYFNRRRHGAWWATLPGARTCGDDDARDGGTQRGVF